MEIKEIMERRMGLEKGLQQMYNKLAEIEKAIDMQKGAIEECNFWVEKLKEEKIVEDSTSDSSEKSEAMKVVEDDK